MALCTCSEEQGWCPLYRAALKMTGIRTECLRRLQTDPSLARPAFKAIAFCKSRSLCHHHHHGHRLKTQHRCALNALSCLICSCTCSRCAVVQLLQLYLGGNSVAGFKFSLPCSCHLGRVTGETTNETRLLPGRVLGKWLLLGVAGRGGGTDQVQD